MLVKAHSVAFEGIDLIEISIEVSVLERGYPSFDIVGLPSKVIAESKHRILTALKVSGISIPAKKTVINLAPAGLPKQGAFYDLPIAVCLMSAALKTPIPPNSVFFGELSLDGSLRPSSSAFVAALLALESGYENVFAPKNSLSLSQVFGGINAYEVGDLVSLKEHFVGENLLTRISCVGSTGSKNQESAPRLEHVIGQEKAKRALVISAAGKHNILLEGPPGTGKTMLSRVYKGLLPPLTDQESLEVTKIYSIKGLLKNGEQLLTSRPHRAPHHTTSYAGMIGGGLPVMPGEISLAHKGVLFMDEFPEFSRRVVESLREPLEDGCISITRGAGTYTFPADFTLVGACNPCPCGYFGSKIRECVCSSRQIHNYKKKLSGPILDRMDIYVYVGQVPVSKLSSEVPDKENVIEMETKNSIRRVRALQKTREGAVLRGDTQKLYHLNDNASSLLKRAVSKLHLSMRGYSKTVCVARTIADLENSELVLEGHVLEALQYRCESG